MLYHAEMGALRACHSRKILRRLDLRQLQPQNRTERTPRQSQPENRKECTPQAQQRKPQKKKKNR